MHKANYNPIKMKKQVEFRKAAKLAKITRGKTTTKQWKRANDRAYQISRSWG